MPEPFLVPGGTLYDALTKTASPNMALVLTGDVLNHIDNLDLQFDVFPQMRATPKAAVLKIAYSKALFMELFESYSITTVAFSKALSGTRNDIIFQIRDQSTIVYCGDVSNGWP